MATKKTPKAAAAEKGKVTAARPAVKPATVTGAAVKKTAGKKAPAKKAASRKAPVKKAPPTPIDEKKAAVKETSAKKAPVKKEAPKTSPGKKAVVEIPAAKKSDGQKAAPDVKTAAPKPPVKPLDRHEVQRRIRVAAYYKFVKRSYRHGQHKSDWYEAEKDIISDL